VAYILADAQVSALLVDPEPAGTAAAVRGRVPGLRTVLATGGAESTSGLGAEGYEPALAGASAEPLVIDVPESEPAFLMYTSGTTGRPKGAVLTHHNLVMNSVNVAMTQGLRDPDEVWLSGLPLFHIGGLNGILFHLLVAGQSIITKSGNFDAGQMVDILERERVTGCYFVPTQWKAICEPPDLDKRDLALRRISWGASIAPPSVLRAMADAFPGVPNFNMFGQTEMSSVTCVLRGEDAIRKMGSVGTPIINVETRIVDDTMNDVPAGEVGEIVYRGPTVMRGYWRKPVALPYPAGVVQEADFAGRGGAAAAHCVRQGAEVPAAGRTPGAVDADGPPMWHRGPASTPCLPAAVVVPATVLPTVEPLVEPTPVLPASPVVPPAAAGPAPVPIVVPAVGQLDRLGGQLGLGGRLRRCGCRGGRGGLGGEQHATGDRDRHSDSGDATLEPGSHAYLLSRLAVRMTREDSRSDRYTAWQPKRYRPPRNCVCNYNQSPRIFRATVIVKPLFSRSPRTGWPATVPTGRGRSPTSDDPSHQPRWKRRARRNYRAPCAPGASESEARTHYTVGQ
jgi:hypothetical protein